MRKTIIILSIALSSCGNVLNKDVFLGDWVMSESTPNYKIEIAQKVILKITKEDIFYKVDILKEDTSMLQEMVKSSKDEQEKKLMQSAFNYQLSPDKRYLINVMQPTTMIAYNDDNKTITTQWGWFKRK